MIRLRITGDKVVPVTAPIRRQALVWIVTAGLIATYAFNAGTGLSVDRLSQSAVRPIPEQVGSARDRYGSLPSKAPLVLLTLRWNSDGQDHWA